MLIVSPTPTHPQDHGNRKRIFEVCAELKRQGARIHFVHYAAEHDWRDRRPRGPERQMIDTWDSYQLVAPSRPLHQASIGVDHDIDEWADSSLGHYIAWICRVQPIDAVIVNYTWMSFCFNYVPAGIFTICDTHDVFGGRRQMLERNGIAPEFFHTTPVEEARGLARADLVWAIKASEQTYFETELGLRNCLTMLHAEPQRSWWDGPPSTDGWLRAGIVGARNNVNKRNVERFLCEALPVIEGYMAPVKILIAGGGTDDFAGMKHPNVELVGRMEDLSGFYRSVDLIIVPMEFSTGLKIKVSEALASGAPMLALAHGSDGYPTDEPLHRLTSFKSMAHELVKLAFDRAPLAALATRSRIICDETKRAFLAALEDARMQLVAQRRRTVCIVAPIAALDDRNLLHEHFTEIVAYLKPAVSVIVYIVGSVGASLPRIVPLADPLKAKYFAMPDLHDALGAAAPDEWAAMPFGQLLESWGIEEAYLLADDEQIRHPAGRLARVCIRFDAVEMAGGQPAMLIESIRGSAKVVIVASEIDRVAGWRSKHGIDAVVSAMFRRAGQFQSLRSLETAAEREKKMLLLANPEDVLAEQVTELARRLSTRVICVDPRDAAAFATVIDTPVRRDPVLPLNDALLLVDLVDEGSVAPVLAEAARRAGVPVVRLVRGLRAVAMGAAAPATRPTSIGRLLQTVARALSEPLYRETLHGAMQQELIVATGNDAGWTWLWHHLHETAEDSDVAASARFLVGRRFTAAAVVAEAIPAPKVSDP